MRQIWKLRYIPFLFFLNMLYKINFEVWAQPSPVQSYCPVKFKGYIGFYVTNVFKWQNEICLIKVPFLSLRNHKCFCKCDSTWDSGTVTFTEACGQLRGRRLYGRGGHAHLAYWRMRHSVYINLLCLWPSRARVTPAAENMLVTRLTLLFLGASLLRECSCVIWEPKDSSSGARGRGQISPQVFELEGRGQLQTELQDLAKKVTGKAYSDNR